MTCSSSPPPTVGGAAFHSRCCSGKVPSPLLSFYHTCLLVCLPSPAGNLPKLPVSLEWNLLIHRLNWVKMGCRWVDDGQRGKMPCKFVFCLFCSSLIKTSSLLHSEQLTPPIPALHTAGSDMHSVGDRNRHLQPDNWESTKRKKGSDLN